MTLAFIPVVIDKCLRNINFYFTFVSLHRICVSLYCQDYVFVLKRKSFTVQAESVFYSAYRADFSQSYGYWNKPLELTIDNVNVNSRSTVSVKTLGLILA